MHPKAITYKVRKYAEGSGQKECKCSLLTLGVAAGLVSILADQQHRQSRSLTYSKIKKLNCTLVQALRPCTGRTAHRGSRGIALLFLDHGTRRG